MRETRSATVPRSLLMRRAYACLALIRAVVGAKWEQPFRSAWSVRHAEELGENPVGVVTGYYSGFGANTYNSKLIAKNNLLVDGKGFEPSTSALRTPRSPN